MLTSSELSLSEARSNTIDDAQISKLHYIGNYERRLPINIARMMENAYDWEHLPFVHSSSFSSIELIADGPWGWRAKAGLPSDHGEQYQLLDLLVDTSRNYWATTVFSGPGEGIQIHTQATSITDTEIKIDVRFYLPSKPDKPSDAEFMLQYLQQQYATLYDEDIELMAGRQSALDDRLRWKDSTTEISSVLVGNVADLGKAKTHTVKAGKGRYCVRFWQDQWWIHSAVCPHLLGPLDDSKINEQGEVTCPWHGYRFNIETGENTDRKCKALDTPPTVVERDGELFLEFE